MKEIVIKMSDEMYDWFINGFPDKADIDELQRLVINGTVLPKGHSRLIEKIAELDFDFGDYYDHTQEIREKVIEAIKKYGGDTDADSN